MASRRLVQRLCAPARLSAAARRPIVVRGTSALPALALGLRPCARACASAAGASQQAGSLGARNADAAAAGDGDATALALLLVVRRARGALKEAGGFVHPDRQVGEPLAAFIGEVRCALRETGAPPTFVRLLETTLDPCWDFAADKARLRTARAMRQALDSVERRLLQMVRSEQFADTRFESLRMDLGSHSSRTTGKGDGAAPRSPNEFAAKENRLMDRQYLANDGVGGRTQFERARNATVKRLERGTVAASEYRAARDGSCLAGAEDMEDIEQRVEDKIQIAMAKGEFDNLEGKGAPLRRLQQPSDNPYLDRSDRLGYDLLQKHGFLPEWIDQQKEIRKAHENAMRALAGAWLDCDEEPCTRWLAHRDAFQESIAALNKRVRDYNLICPAASQMPHFVFTEELRHVRRNARDVLRKASERPPSVVAAPAPPKRLMTPLREVFSRPPTRVAVPSGDERSIWERVADAVSFRR